MQNSDLVEIVSALTLAEKERVPFFLDKSKERVKPDVRRLIIYVLECIHDEESSALHKKETYAFLFPGQGWVDNKLEKLMSAALSVVKDFIAEEGAIGQLNDLNHTYMLQKFYNERGLVDKSRASYRQIIRAKGKSENWTSEEYYTNFLSEKEESNAQSFKNHGKNDLNLQNVMHALSEYYLVEQLWLMCHLINQKQIAPLELPSLEELSLFNIHSPNLRWFFEKPLGQLFEKTINLLINEDQGNVQGLKGFVDLLRTHESKISKQDAYLFEMSACNLGIRRVNKGEFEYLEVVFEIQQQRVTSGRIYTSKGQISASEFLSILTNSLRLDALEWGWEFIENHKRRIVGAMPTHNYYEFALATYYYKIKDYQETRKILMTSDYEDTQYRMSARILEIKALYELSILEGTDHRVGEYLEDRVEAGILFFFRLKDVEPRKKRMGKRFADTMKRIIHAKGNSDTNRLKKIGDDVQAAELIAERQWLLGIIDDLTKEMDNP